MKNKLARFLNDKLDLPVDSLLSLPNVNIIGNTVLDIDGCIGIKKYENDEIILRAKDFVITVKGMELSMLTFSQGRINIRGIITAYLIEEL